MAFSCRGMRCLVSLCKRRTSILKSLHTSSSVANPQAAASVVGDAETEVKRIFSGIQPTGVPHIGNYLGSIRSWVELQEEPETEMVLSIADLHSITLPQDPAQLRESILTTVAVLLACGIDPDRCILFQQSSVSQHAELGWILGCKTTIPRLGQFPQWKSKAGNDKSKSCIGLFTYPILQSADILLYKATHVPVGEDQVPHLELAQDLARIFNNAYGEFFPAPKAVVGEFRKVKSLRNPEQKMSKSEQDPRSRIMLTDSHRDINEKFKKAKTDFTTEVTYDPESRPGVSNIVSILCAFTGKDPAHICRQSEILTTAQFKLVVADVISEKLAPIRKRFREIRDDVDYLENVLRTGEQKAREIAQPNYERVKKMVGLS
ncbi:tryptophan--tRNA ligase, mitochondrial-like [Diadema antillarum]|uniref:tryptophan--tRNA ligase, mitochondrial-like n=1 Tax=Diadema antillarum TaxID=105358 RepID=UPI003A87475A